MELENIKEVASAHARSLGGSATASLFNKGLRTNLITLLCQSETVEAVGTVEVFSGTKDMTGNMGRAIFNLFCLADVLGVDLAAGIEKAIADAKQKLASIEGEATGGATAPNPENKPAETSQTSTETSSTDEEAMASSIEKCEGAEQPAGADPGTTGGDPKAKKIEAYRSAFKEAKTSADIKTLWNTVVQDKDLAGPDRFALQTDKKEAEKRTEK